MIKCFRTALPIHQQIRNFCRIFSAFPEFSQTLFEFIQTFQFRYRREFQRLICPPLIPFGFQFDKLRITGKPGIVEPFFLQFRLTDSLTACQFRRFKFPVFRLCASLPACQILRNFQRIKTICTPLILNFCELKFLFPWLEFEHDRLFLPPFFPFLGSPFPEQIGCLPMLFQFGSGKFALRPFSLGYCNFLPIGHPIR